LEYTGVPQAPFTILALYRVVWLRLETVKVFPLVVPDAGIHVDPLVNCSHVTVPDAPEIVKVALFEGCVEVTSQSIVGLVLLEEEVTDIEPAKGRASTDIAATFDVALPQLPATVT